jgi:2-haloacid dehalogenase
MNRREALKGLSRGVALAAFPGFASGASVMPKALVFDTFGTVVDWRGSIIEEGRAFGKRKGFELDWGDFADRWRAGYAPAMDKVRKGQMPWTNLDALHRMILDEIMTEFRMLPPMSPEEKDNWVRVWHRLKPWPDSVAGLKRLKKKFTIAPLSNGNVALLADMAKHSGLPWDLILSAELAKHYKPDREAYLTAVDLLELKPQDVMMTAAHIQDLNAARELGLRTGFVYRPNEYGPAERVRHADKATPGQFDVVAKDVIDLAAQLGA